MSKTAKITIYKAAVLASIDAQTFKRVDGVLSTESDQIKNALSSDSAENLDKYILHEHMEQRDATIRKRLSYCLVVDEDTLSVNNLLDVETEKFEYNLSVPDTANKQKLQIMAKKIHNYIVQGSLFDWYATQNMKGNVSESALAALEDEIAGMLRTSFVKRPIQPFGPR